MVEAPAYSWAKEMSRGNPLKTFLALLLILVVIVLMVLKALGDQGVSPS